jgi:coatomer subunit beta'
MFRILILIPIPQSIQDSERTKIAQFLDAQGLKEKALEITNDNDHKFDLAVQLGRLDYAYEIAKQSDTEHKWKVLSDMAMQELNFQLSEECMWQANDLNGLLLLFSSNGSAEGMSKLAARAKSLGKFNVAFNCLLLLGQVDECIELLVQAGRVPEAAIFARSYAPSRIADVVKIWKDELAKSSPRVAEAIADPLQYPNLFPGFEDVRGKLFRYVAFDCEADVICRRISRPSRQSSDFPVSKGLLMSRPCTGLRALTSSSVI